MMVDSGSSLPAETDMANEAFRFVAGEFLLPPLLRGFLAAVTDESTDPASLLADDGTPVEDALEGTGRTESDEGFRAGGFGRGLDEGGGLDEGVAGIVEVPLDDGGTGASSDPLGRDDLLPPPPRPRRRGGLELRELVPLALLGSREGLLICPAEIEGVDGALAHIESARPAMRRVNEVVF